MRSSYHSNIITNIELRCCVLCQHVGWFCLLNVQDVMVPNVIGYDYQRRIIIGLRSYVYLTNIFLSNNYTISIDSIETSNNHVRN